MRKRQATIQLSNTNLPVLSLLMNRENCPIAHMQLTQFQASLGIVVANQDQRHAKGVNCKQEHGKCVWFLEKHSQVLFFQFCISEILISTMCMLYYKFHTLHFGSKFDHVLLLRNSYNGWSHEIFTLVSINTIACWVNPYKLRLYLILNLFDYYRYKCVPSINICDNSNVNYQWLW